MKTLHLVQGSPGWHAHRAAHWNASDAPAMLGVSPNKTRTQLLRELATGVAREFSDFVQERVIDPGHAFEANARAIAEQIVGEDLYPCTGSEGRFSASFDGLTLMGNEAFEHKSMNADLDRLLDGECGDILPEHYRVQMEHQCMVSGAVRVLFMASRWSDDGKMLAERHCWYYPDHELRARIVAGWAQFDADLANYQPEPIAGPALVGRAPETLPSLRVEAQGMVTFSNLAEFKAHALTVLGGISRDLQTDEDFANAEQTVKWCKGVEDRLDAAKANVLSQMSSVDEVCRTIDDVSAETRRIRLELDRLVKSEKESRRSELVAAGVAAVREHYAAINATLGEHAVLPPQSLALDIGSAIKGKKSLVSMRDAIDATAAAAKIDASQRAERVRACIAVLAAHKEHATLFADRVTLCATKAPDDLCNLAAARIAEHKRTEDAKREATDRVLAERAAQQNASERGDEPGSASCPAGEATRDYTGELRAAGDPGRALAKPPASSARIKLGDINQLIAPLAITSEGLASLGFAPVGNDRAAKLYAADDLPEIFRTLARRLSVAASQPIPARAA